MVVTTVFSGAQEHSNRVNSLFSAKYQAEIITFRIEAVYNKFSRQLFVVTSVQYRHCSKILLHEGSYALIKKIYSTVLLIEDEPRAFLFNKAKLLKFEILFCGI